MMNVDRLPRLDFPGARHIVTNRGARKQDIFHTDRDRKVFLALLSQLPRRFGVQVHAWALNPNHFHLLLRSRDGALSRSMQHLCSRYVQRFNLRHGFDGPLFKARFHNRLVRSEAHWRHLLAYVNGNPAKDGFADELGARGWTSHAAYMDHARRPSWLCVDEHLELYGGKAQYDRYARDWLSGAATGPEGFDEAQIWTPRETAVLGEVPRLDPDEVLARGLRDLMQVMEASMDELLFSPTGRCGNPRAWVAAWWLSRWMRVPHGALREIAGISSSTLSKRIRKAEDRHGDDAQITAWMDRLVRRHGERLEQTARRRGTLMVEESGDLAPA